jgi:hypothetical protein
MNGKVFLSKTLVMVISVIVFFSACATRGTVPSADQIVYDDQSYEQEQRYSIPRGILKMYSNFRGTTENAGIKLQIDFSHENLAVLRNRYGLETIAGTGDDLSKSLNILFWLCEHVRHFGSYDNHIPMNALDLLEYAYDQGEERGINCLNLCYILTECLLSIGVPARTVAIMPFSPYDADNHVVAQVYITDLGKWVMLDPTWNAYFKDAGGNILDVIELRRFLADGRDVFLNEEVAYNGASLITNAERIQYYKWYMTKNLFFFTFSEISGFGKENRGRDLSICPASFNLFEAWMYRLEYNIEFIRTYEGISEDVRQSFIESATVALEEMRISAQENDENAEGKGYLYVSLEDFLAKPDLNDSFLAL